MKHLGKTARRDIAEAGYVKLGGLDQWVVIRGADRRSPPLIFLHGGPGFTEPGFLSRCSDALEEHFTLVYWDQRGAGRSFHRRIARSTMNVEQFLRDLDELVGHVRRRLGVAKVALLGHSWGAALGVLYAKRFPEKVAVYVGTGQVGDWAAAEAASYAFGIAEAQRQGDDKTLAKLQKLGPPPYDAKQLFRVRTLVMRLDGGFRPRALVDLGRLVLAAPNASPGALVRTMRAFRFSLDAMWAEASHLDLLTAAPELAVPVFLFLGRNDHWVPPETSVAWFDRLRAPAKTLVWFESSGHEPFVDEPRKFTTAMLEMVRPLLRSRAGDRSLSEKDVRQNSPPT